MGRHSSRVPHLLSYLLLSCCQLCCSALGTREIICGLLSQPVLFRSKELDHPGLKGEPDFGGLAAEPVWFRLFFTHAAFLYPRSHGSGR